MNCADEVYAEQSSAASWDIGGNRKLQSTGPILFIDIDASKFCRRFIGRSNSGPRKE
jgi:hypothetical protein